MSLIHNESTKLTATWLNTLAAATVATGVIAPMVALVFGVPTSAAISAAAFVIATVIWLGLGMSLHLLARAVLRRLQE